MYFDCCSYQKRMLSFFPYSCPNLKYAQRESRKKVHVVAAPAPMLFADATCTRCGHSANGLASLYINVELEKNHSNSPLFPNIILQLQYFPGPLVSLA